MQLNSSKTTGVMIIVIIHKPQNILDEREYIYFFCILTDSSVVPFVSKKLDLFSPLISTWVILTNVFPISRTRKGSSASIRSTTSSRARGARRQRNAGKIRAGRYIFSSIIIGRRYLGTGIEDKVIRSLWIDQQWTLYKYTND